MSLTTPTTEKASVFRTYVHDAYAAAATAFGASPTTENWQDLKIAMWAWQLIYQRQAPELATAARDHLITIAGFAKGDADFTEK